MNPRGRRSIRIFEGAAHRNSLKRMIEAHEDKIDFLKVDCEGYEYDLLLRCR